MKKHFTFFTVLCSIIMLCGCGAKDLPADTDTPWPANHNGVFTSEYGSMTFNGDGKSVTVNFNDELSEAVSFPKGELEGEYAFTFQHGLWRYDRADSFEIIIGGCSYRFMNDFQNTNENTISIVSPIDAAVTICFEKEE